MNENKPLPTYKRQRFLLAFITQLMEGITATDLQKLIFLYTMQEEGDVYYDFTPYKYGAYSFQLNQDVTILCNAGFLYYQTTQTGSQIIRSNSNFDEVTTFTQVNERGDALKRKAYREYPYYTINSEIINKLFHGKERERFINERCKYLQESQVLLTIGYEGLSVEAFCNTLIQNDARILCDVRKNPISRKFGFSKSKLKHILDTVGIKYVHLPDLGIDSSKRSSLCGADDYFNLFAEYSKNLTNLSSQIEQISTLLSSDNRVAIMCYEKEPNLCHRHVIRDYIIAQHGIRSEDL